MRILESLKLSNNSFYSKFNVTFINLYQPSIPDLHSNNITGFMEKKINKVGREYTSIDVSSNRFTCQLDKNIGNKLAMDASLP